MTEVKTGAQRTAQTEETHILVRRPIEREYQKYCFVGSLLTFMWIFLGHKKGCCLVKVSPKSVTWTGARRWAPGLRKLPVNPICLQRWFISPASSIGLQENTEQRLGTYHLVDVYIRVYLYNIYIHMCSNLIFNC